LGKGQIIDLKRARIRRNRFINKEKKNYTEKILKLVRNAILFNRYFIKLIIISFILFTLFVGNTGIQLGKNEKSFLISRDTENGIIIEKPLNYTENLEKNKNLAIALAANSFSNESLAVLITDGSAENNKKEDKKTSLAVFNNNSFMSGDGYQEVLNTGDNVVNYVVENGDSPASIAESFGITTDTVLWANKLKSGDVIRPGDVLRILPISGIEHKIASKETLDAIAKKYKAKSEDIIVYNSLPANGEIKVGEYLIVPNGVIPAAPKPKKAPVVIVNHDENVWVNPVVKSPVSGQSHKFPWGQCTYWVAQKRYVPWGGDAKRWLNNAQAFGYKTGKTPVVGSIVVTTENARYGHVAYVEAVGETTITVSEMNYKGLGIISQRVLPLKSRVIRGYIY